MIHKLIGPSTASTPTGLPTQRKLFRVPGGPFAGRLVVVYSRTATNLALSYADPPYTSWLAPGDFVTESANVPFSAVMDGNANLYVAYTQQTTDALRCVKLIFANGTWATQTPVTVYDSASSSNKHPSILNDIYNRLWIVWTRDDAGTYTLRVKNSVDDGLTFGAGPTDAGTDLSGSATSCYGSIIARPSHLHCVFTVDGTVFKHRSIHIDAALWNAVETLYTGTGLGSDIGVAVSNDAKFGALFVADGQLFLKEYDGAVWGALQTVINQAVVSPSLRYVGTAPYAIFLRSIGTDQFRLFESHRVGGSFAAAIGVLSQQATFASVFCFDADAGVPYADLTGAASSSTGADVFHPMSAALIKAVGDAVYCGLDDRFSIVRVLLSTVGVGGTVTWSYWNGAEWSNFVPNSGAWHFDSANAGVRLFADGATTPVDWQKVVVNGANRYWIRATVATAYTTGPIGSQITAVPKAANVVLKGN